MALLGSAVVAIWNDITPQGRDNFIEWHNREHIPERIGIPGFLRGRRYVAEYGTPAYYTLYEAADQAVLTGAAYLERLNNPTPWTREATAEFRNTLRGVCATRYSRGSGDGGMMLTVRFDAEADRGAGLEQGIVAALDKIGAMKGISGTHLCIADSAASGIETAERKGRQVDVPNWIVMIEGSSPAAVDAAGEALSAELARLGGTGAVEKGLYRLEFSLADVRA
ncbi:MAG: hypothetical protein KIT48_09805 [Pseudolabrys sp.]|nr:hypothetical protein [Pseudolabrys sp.]